MSPLDRLHVAQQQLDLLRACGAPRQEVLAARAAWSEAYWAVTEDEGASAKRRHTRPRTWRLPDATLIVGWFAPNVPVSAAGD